ncbi:tol-pal system-associated acyl-CoA thioesterase [Methylocystis sp. JAN1]|uniref:tol-pal system-associated acyl-CoA thioesterase n=1 Tax=Methylocystis sp. JAN1 TaxID=3397211 RepID=UPI003FA23BBF
MTAAHTLSVRVYWEDTDASGLVYHTSYVRFMERGRTELLRSLGLDQRPLLEGAAGAPTFFVVRAMQLDFIRPAAMDDLLSVETRVLELGGASLRLDQRVLRGDETLVTATVKVVCVEAGRAKRLPPDVRDKFLRAHAASLAG